MIFVDARKEKLPINLIFRDEKNSTRLTTLFDYCNTLDMIHTVTFRWKIDNPNLLVQICFHIFMYCIDQYSSSFPKLIDLTVAKISCTSRISDSTSINSCRVLSWMPGPSGSVSYTWAVDSRWYIPIQKWKLSSKLEIPK